MTWTDLKESITQDYRSRGLKDAQARLNALKRVESMLFEIFPDFDGIVLCNMDKDDLKQILESKKGKKSHCIGCRKCRRIDCLCAFDQGALL